MAKVITTCTRCVMDDAVDQTITFDNEGVCSYCTKAIKRMETTYYPGKAGDAQLKEFLNILKSKGKGKPYDCMMGISGGLDSSYLAYKAAVEWGLRIFAVHIDDGFDTVIAKQNIDKLCQATGIQLKVVAPDAEQFYDLTRAFIRAQVPNIAMPQDNVLFACLHEEAKCHDVKSFLSGGNFALECILEQGNTHDVYDMINMRDIHGRFGTIPMDKLPMMSLFQKGFTEKYFYGIKTYRPLNYIDYNRDRAIEELAHFCGFNYYGNKHLENTFTVFTQLYWFYNKYGVDKRKSHYSSMIVSGQMTRDEGLKKLKEPLYEEGSMQMIIDEVLEKLKIEREEFDKIMKAPSLQHTDYRTSLFGRMAALYFSTKR